MWTKDSNRRRPAVMHVVHSVEPGGTERVLHRLVRALGASERRHVVCALRDPRPFGGGFGEDLEWISLGAGRRDRFLFLKLARAIRRYGAGIIHARNWGTWTDATLAARLVPGVRLILGFHGLQDGRHFTAGQQRRARWLGMDRQMVTTVSEAARDQVVGDLGFQPQRIRVIPNGVDLHRFTPATAKRRTRARAHLGLADDHLLIGSVANFFETVKGQPLLVDAFAKLVLANQRAKLVLVGYGPLEGSVRAHVARAGLEGRVTFTGQLENVPEILPAFDVFVCSSYSEGMSNAVLEAMATALPCVVTDVADHRHMFRQVDPDLVVPCGDAQSLATELVRLATDAGRRAAVGARARALIEQRYSFERTVDGYRRV